LRQELGEESVDVVVDNVAGSLFATMIKLLKRGGRLVSSGAIAGPIEEGEIQSNLAKTLPLSSIVEAQKEFVTKQHVGKFVLIPPHSS
jgi:NADPH:quinone reductase-like Zn-dependent oxidoreductase